MYEVHNLYQLILDNGIQSSPRDQKILELPYFQGVITNPWSTYEERSYPMDYFKAEMQWYLGADRQDTRITNHAKMWSKLVQNNGDIFSNYGYYWFNPEYNPTYGRMFDWVVNTLHTDPDSRQAYIPMNNVEHFFKGNSDMVCTKGIQFRIMDNQLCMHVAMRSSDAWYGVATDLPCFALLQEMVYNCLKFYMPLLTRGPFVFSADSLHLYEKHWDKADVIAENNGVNFQSPDMPEMETYADLLLQKYESKLGRWLNQVEL